MYDPVIFFDPRFVTNVIAGWVLVLLGALLLLCAGVWWSWANEPGRVEKAPRGWRALAGLGWVCFLAGIAWQVVGYVRVGAATF